MASITPSRFGFWMQSGVKISSVSWRTKIKNGDGGARSVDEDEDGVAL